MHKRPRHNAVVSYVMEDTIRTLPISNYKYGSVILVICPIVPI